MPDAMFDTVADAEHHRRRRDQADLMYGPHHVEPFLRVAFCRDSRTDLVIEYLAAGAHCITTPMGRLESDLETGITYMPDNTPEMIAATLKKVIEDRRYENVAPKAAEQAFGAHAVSMSLDEFVGQVVKGVPGK